MLVAAALASVCRAQTTPATQPASSEPTTQPLALVHRTNHAPKIDGRLDDACWRDADRITDLVQADPLPGAPPSERTEVLLCYDDNNLYIAFRCLDSHPSEIIGKQMARDGLLLSDDFVGVAIDTFHDRRNGYLFQIGAAGAKRDALLESGGTARLEWDGIWHARTSIDREGWIAEIAIPFKTLNFDPNASTWGFNVERTIRRKQEVDRWAAANQTAQLRNINDAGNLQGFAGLKQGLGLSIEPFLSTKLNFDDNDLDLKPGFDAFWKITPSITAALTVNTDFAETEVDERQVNLTRFPLFFPEKRDFFLQDAGIFSFGGIGQSPLPFFSRRIGIVNGHEQDILTGLKVTGRQGDLSFGLMDVQMKDDDVLGEKNLSVARGTLNVFKQSTVGVIGTYGDPDSTHDNALGGLDFNYRTSDSVGKHIVEGHAWVLGTHSTDDTIGDDNAFGGKIAYPNDDLSLSLFFANIGPRFDPALGFVERTGVREYDSFARYRWRPKSYIHRIDVADDTTIFTELDNDIQSAGTEPFVELENVSGDIMDIGANLDREVLTEPFEIHDGITIPTGGYNFARPYIYFETTKSRPVSIALWYRSGGFYDGNRQDYEASVEWRPSSRFFTSVDYELNDIHLDEGSFVVRILRVRANILFSPQVSWNNFIQFDNESDSLGINSRLRWEFEPGREAFVVLNQGWNIDDGRWRSDGSELTIKLGMTFRF